MDEMHSMEPVYLMPQRPPNPFLVMIAIVVGVFAVVALITGAIIAWRTFLQVGVTIFYIVAVAVILAIIVGIVVLVYSFVKHQQRKDREKDLEQERAANAVAAEKKMNDAKAELLYSEALHRRNTALLTDGLGNAFNVDPYGRLTSAIGNSQVPHSLHCSIKNETPPALEVPPQQLLSGPQNLPKVEMFYDLIPYNSLSTGMGQELVSGKPVIATIRKSTHFKLIGGSGMGKSCLSGGMLDIAAATNDPDHLRIGLLDLEHNTSRLFEDLPHIAELGPRRQRLIGRDPDEVAQKLKLLQLELTRRANLGEEHCTLHEPVLLVYVEEMLALKYEVVDEKLKKEMLAAINILGVRARKYGIFLLACMQTDYSDKSTREAMAQFRTRAGFAIDPEVARASGFFNTDLVKQNFQTGCSGQYVLEKPQYSGLVLAPDYDVAAKLERLSGPTTKPTTGSTTNTAESHYEHGQNRPYEVAQRSPTTGALEARQAPLTTQEWRIIEKWRKGDGIKAIIASEFTNGRGEPLTGGDLFTQKAKEIQVLIARFLPVQE